MRVLKALVMVLFVAMLMPLAVISTAGAAVDTGYIAGEVGFQGEVDGRQFTTTSVSMTAVGGGTTAQQTTYDIGTYQLPVVGGNSYLVSASCGLSDAAGNPFTVYFNQRNIAVTAGAAAPNDYLFIPGIVRFHVSISGDPTITSASAGLWATKAMASGEKTSTYSFGARAESAREFAWDLPVVPNQQIELTAKIDVTGTDGEVVRYSFGKSTDSRYNLAPVDVLPGQVKDVYLAINFTSGDTPPASTYKGSVSGRVNLLGLPATNFVRHTLSASPSKTVTANPGTYLKDYNLTGNQLVVSSGVPSTTFDASLDGSPLRWPWPRVNGQSFNPSNNVTVYPNNTTYLDFERAGGFLTGSINFSGSVANEGLKAITLTFDGVGNVYDADAKQWGYRENYFGNASVKRDNTLAGAKPTTVRDYQLFLTTGDWNLSFVSLTKQQQSPLRTSSVTFKDHKVQYDGSNFLGTPSHVDQGTNEQDFDYCLGSAIFRFKDPDGRLLSSPLVSGTNGTHKTNGVTDLTISSFSASASVSNVAEQEVELFGPPGDYNVSTINYTPSSGAKPPFPARTLTISCGTTKVFDVAGPTLSVASPQAELVTNAASLAVAGNANPYSRTGFPPAAITTVTVNGQTATLTDAGNGKKAFLLSDLQLSDGENVITVTATDANQMQATEQLIVFADRWQPTLAITAPADGDQFLTTEASIPVHVDAADLGYGYTLTVSLDGAPIHTVKGAGNIAEPVALVYDGLFNTLPLGEHVIAATVTDRAGNSITSSNKIYVVAYVPPPVLFGVANQNIEATSPDGAVAIFDVSATATCSQLQSAVVVSAPVLRAQSNSAIVAGSIAKTFEWSAVTVSDGHPAQYLVQVSATLDFSAIAYNSDWLSAASWTQALPAGTWFWRVTARDSVDTELLSTPAIGNSFRISSNQDTRSFGIREHYNCPIVGECYSAPLLYAGPYEEGDGVDGVDRSFLMFDTASIGTGVTITSAKLNLDYQDRTYVLSPAVTEVRESTWDAASITYNGYVGALLASQPITVSRLPGIVTFDIRPDYIATTGATRFALKADDENYLTLGNADPGYASATSTLEVSYLSSTPPWAAPVLTPQPNAATSGEDFEVGFQWSEVAAMDGDPVEYRVDISSTVDFSENSFSSGWQLGTNWTKSLPLGTWYWRVTARDANHTAITSETAASGFIIYFEPPAGGPVVVTCTPSSGSTFPLGNTTVNCTAKDDCNSTATGSFTISVQDTMPPEMAVPANLVIEATAATGTPVEFNVTAMDTIDLSPAVTCAPASGSVFPVGTTIVTCTASDASGNKAAEAFEITVEDPRPPVLTVPADMTVEATGPLTPVDIGQASATHILPFTINNDAPEAYPVATTVVTWTASDANGKTASGVQSVTVTDTTAPVVTAPANLMVEAAGTLTQVSTGAATAADAVGVTSITSDAPAAFPVGMTTVTWTATDAAGNIGVAVQTVTVTDQTPPMLHGLANLSLEATSASGAVATFSVTVNDLVDPEAAVTCSAASGSAFPLGETTITCTTTDASGNSGSGSFTITVRDTTSPVLTPPENITVLLNTLVSAQQVQDFLNGATAVDTVDASVTVTATASEAFSTVTAIASEVFDTVGAKQVTFTAVDEAGNRATRTATIHVVYGCGDEFMEPVSLHKPFKLGSTVPVKIGFCDASGAAVTSAVVRLFLYPVSNAVPAEEPIEIQSPGTEDTGNLFKVAGDEYHYNLKTTNLSPGTFQIRAVLDDGTTRTVPFALK